MPTSRARAYDDVKYIVAAVLGIPMLAGLVFTLLYFVNVAWQAAGVIAATVVFLAGVALLIWGTYKSVELLRRSPGGR